MKQTRNILKRDRRENLIHAYILHFWMEAVNLTKLPGKEAQRKSKRNCSYLLQMTLLTTLNSFFMVLAWVQKSITVCHVAISEQYLVQGDMVQVHFFKYFFCFDNWGIVLGFFFREIIMFEASTWFLHCTWVLSRLCSHKGKHTHLIWIYSSTDCISGECFGFFFIFLQENLDIFQPQHAFQVSDGLKFHKMHLLKNYSSMESAC